MKRKQPNIIYILSDDHRAELLGAMGHPVVQTPHLDRLASEGVLFERAFCTSPACTPSRTCHYTGQWERRHGINFNSRSVLSEDAWDLSFPVQLKKQGYFTGWIGKNHVPVVTSDGQRYLETTFDYWYGNHGHSGFYPKEANDGDIYRNAKADTQIEIFEESIMNFLDPQEEFIESCTRPLPYRNVNQPFCLFVTYNLPHNYGTMGMQLRPTDDELYITGYRDRFNDMPLPPSYIEFTHIKEPKIPLELYSGTFLPSYDYVKTAQTLKERLVRKCQTLTGIDRTVGRVREKLEQLGLSDNTILVYSTDHGIHHGEHGLGGKCFLYEEDLHIPLFILDPRQPAEGKGQRRRELVVVPDLAPTLLELADAPVPDSMQGTSLVPLLAGKSPEWREHFFAEQLMDIQNYPKSECIRTSDWKYIRYFPRTENPAHAGMHFRSTIDPYYPFLRGSLEGSMLPVYEELYHLVDDPHEQNNLAGDPAYACKLSEMRSKLVEAGLEALGDGEPQVVLW